MLKNWIIAGTLAVALVPSLSFAAVEISDGSVKALYHLSDTVDSSGNGHNLTNNGSVTFSAGLLGNAAVSNGTNSLSVASNLGIDGTAAEIDVWVYNQTTFDAAGEHLYYQQSAGTDVAYAFLGYDSSGTKHLMARRERVGTANCQVDTTYTLPAGWTFLTLSYQPNLLEFFINNVSQGTQSCSGSGTGATDKTELFAKNGGENWTGKMDELVVSTGISTTTRALLFNSGSGAEVCVTAGCAAGSSTSTSTSTPTMTEALQFQIFVILDAIFFFACLAGFIYVLSKTFNL